MDGTRRVVCGGGGGGGTLSKPFQLEHHKSGQQNKRNDSTVHPNQRQVASNATGAFENGNGVLLGQQKLRRCALGRGSPILTRLTVLWRAVSVCVCVCVLVHSKARPPTDG